MIVALKSIINFTSALAIYTYFQIKAPQNPNLFRRQMFKYIAYIRESPPVLICLIRSFHSSVNMPAAT